VRFEIEVDLNGKVYAYSIAFEFPEGFRELRVFEEKLMADGKPVYTREAAQVPLAKDGQEKEATFGIDWHLVALPIVQLKSSPIIQLQSTDDPLFIFKQRLARMLILRPMPSLILGDSKIRCSRILRSLTLARGFQVSWLTPHLRMPRSLTI